MNQSVLWKNSSEIKDRELLFSLLKHYSAGDDKHFEKCVNKILKNIQTKKWQETYPNRAFVFCVFYASNIRLTEIRFSLACQAIDSLHFQKFKTKEHINFGEKASGLFNNIYGKKMPDKTENVLNIIRNDILHYGELTGIKEARYRKADSDLIEKFLLDFETNDQKLNDVQKIGSLANSFVYLSGDIVLRVLGLDWEDLNRNGNPPSLINHFRS